MSLNSFESVYDSNSDSDSYSEICQLSSNFFKLNWSFGLNSKAPIINLSNKSRSLVAYACLHVAVLYDYTNQEMFTLQGHRSYVRALSIDDTGKWLLTSNFDNDPAVIIWDIENRIPICTIFNPHGENEMTSVSLSPNAKYIVTVGNETVQIVKLWLWTYGRKDFDAEIKLCETCSELVKDITFSRTNTNLFALTMDRCVAFITWREANKNLYVHYSRIVKKTPDVGIFNNTTFVVGVTKAFTGSTNGFVIVWDIKVSNSIQDKIEMEHIKSVPLQNENITKIVNYKSFVVTGNSQGNINFYDSDLRILYWCRNCGLDSITSISFEIEPVVGNFNDVKKMNCDVTNDVSCEREIERNAELDNVMQHCSRIPSNITEKMEYYPKPRNLPKTCDEKVLKFKEKFKKFEQSRDATLNNNIFYVDKFIVATIAGKLAWFDVTTLQYRLISNYFNSPLTAFDAHPQIEYFVTADKEGKLFLFNYRKRQLMLTKNIAAVPELITILKKELLSNKITYVSNAKLIRNCQNPYATALKYSPTGNLLICGMNNGIVWILHPDTLDPLDPYPYKHTRGAISKIIFSENLNFIAYYDDANTIAVLKKNINFSKQCTYFYDFVGKYHSHTQPIRDILFGSPLNENQKTPRLLSLGEDRDLIEYDLIKSGPYPDPGLIILQITRIEQEDIPFCMTWYPEFIVEKCLVISNSDYKFKLVDSVNKEIKATVLGPTFSSPVKRMMPVCQLKGLKNSTYMLFATDKEIGIQLLPFDGNPYKIVGFTAHPKKICWIGISNCGKILFTVGHDDLSVIMWRINYKSVDAMHQLGGNGLSPFFGLMAGGKEGWLFKKMKNLFVHAQILQEGENSMQARQICDEVSVEQLPNLMRALGFYPSQYQLDNLMKELSFKNSKNDKDTVKTINFEDFIKLYINHRPVFGITMQRLKNAFRTLGEPEDFNNFTLPKHRFIDILCEKQTADHFKICNKIYDDSLSTEEARSYLKHLMLHESNEKVLEYADIEESINESFNFLPNRISYKDFATNFMGIESPKETRAENVEK